MMNKHRTYSLLALIGGLSLLSACSREMYDGEFSAEGFYEGAPQVYFDQSSDVDTIEKHDLGLISSDQTELTLQLPVRYTGYVSKQPVPYAARVVSFSGDGSYLKALEKTYYIPADSIRSSLPIKLERSKISVADTEGNLIAVLRDGKRVLVDPSKTYGYEPNPDEDVQLPTDVPISKYDTVTIELQPMGDTQMRFTRRIRKQLIFTNAVAQPTWWNYFTAYFGAFSADKLRYLIAGFPGGDVDTIYRILFRQGNYTTMDIYKVYVRMQQYFQSRGETVPPALSSYLARYIQ